MSEFWKKRRPRLSEDEERALWERVRTMPSEAGGVARHAERRSPWAALWARPAVRFGAPVLAVALVAIVWVAQRAPEAPRPEIAATRPVVGAGIVEDAAPAPMAAPAPAAESRARTMASESEIASDQATPSPRPLRERAEGVSGAAPQMAKEAPAFAEPPSVPTAGAERKDEASRGAAKAGVVAAPAPTKITVIKGGADTQALAAPPAAGSAADLRGAAIRGGDYVSRMLQDVVRPSAVGPFGTIVDLPLSASRVYLQRDAGGRWKVHDDPLVLDGSMPRPGPLERRAALAAELVRGIKAQDASGIDRVRAAALELQRELPADEGVRALVAWTVSARESLEER